MAQKLQPAHASEVRVTLEGMNDTDSWTIAAFEKIGGYEQAKKAVTMVPDEIVAVVKNSGLRGLGGAGFATGVKWSFIPKNRTKPVYLVCNADEGEPGTFKDRQILEHCPHRLVEGMIIAASAINSEAGYIYVRGEMRLGIERIKLAVNEAYEKGYLGKNLWGSGRNFDLTVHYGCRRLYLRRRNRPHLVAGRSTRTTSLEASVPRDQRRFRRAHNCEQRRNSLPGSWHYQKWPRVVFENG